MHCFTYRRGIPWEGYDAATMAHRIGVPAPLPSGLVPAYRVVFRATRTRESPHLDAVELAFFDELSTARGWRARLARRIRLWLSIRAGRATLRSVAGVTHWASSGDTPPEPGRQASEHLAVLNDFLTAYGLADANPLIGSLSADELPSRAPLIGTIPAIDGVAVHRIIHGVGVWDESLLNRPREEHDLQRASVTYQSAGARDPTFRVIALLHSASRDLFASRYLRAVAFAGTAIELLVQSTLQRAWTASGEDPTRLPKALRAGFRNRVDDHLHKVLGVPRLDVGDEQSEIGRWWRDGYGLRNLVVHDGRAPTFAETRAAVASALAFCAFVGRSLEAQPQTAELRGMLPTHQVPPRRYSNVHLRP